MREERVKIGFERECSMGVLPSCDFKDCIIVESHFDRLVHLAVKHEGRTCKDWF
jgi:hypothetical protein